MKDSEMRLKASLVRQSDANGLGRIMAKLSNTAETTIAITFLVMNLELLLKQFFIFLFNTSSNFIGLRKFFCPFLLLTRTSVRFFWPTLFSSF